MCTLVTSQGHIWEWCDHGFREQQVILILAPQDLESVQTTSVYSRHRGLVLPYIHAHGFWKSVESTCCIDAMADCSQKPGEKKVIKTSTNLERLKRSPYLVSPILSPMHGGTGVRVRNHPWLAMTVDQPKATANKSPHRDRGAELITRATTNTYDEDARKPSPAKHSANDDGQQGCKASSTGTEQYFCALECQLRSSGINHNHNSSTTDPHIQQTRRFEAHSLQEYFLADGKLAPYKCSAFLGPVKVQEVPPFRAWIRIRCNVHKSSYERPVPVLMLLLGNTSQAVVWCTSTKHNQYICVLYQP